MAWLRLTIRHEHAISLDPSTVEACDLVATSLKVAFCGLYALSAAVALLALAIACRSIVAATAGRPPRP